MTLTHDQLNGLYTAIVTPLTGDGAVDVKALHQLVRFAIVGGLSTIAYALLFVWLRGPIGAQAANFTALLLTAIANTAANRRLTFGIRGSAAALRHQGQGLVVFALGWALSAGSLWILQAAAPTAPHAVELAVVVAANLGATVLRFVLMRGWVFRTHRASSLAPTGARTEGPVR